MKFGEKTYNKKWQEIRKCLNQKCLDKKREHNRRLAVPDAANEQ